MISASRVLRAYDRKRSGQDGKRLGCFGRAPAEDRGPMQPTLANGVAGANGPEYMSASTRRIARVFAQSVHGCSRDGGWWRFFAAVVLIAGVWPPAGVADPPADSPASAELKRLIDRIASEDPTESHDATEALIDKVVSPVAAAVGRLDERPMAARMQIDDALRQVYAELRARLFRAELPAADRQLFDEFAALYPLLVRRVFDGDASERLAALDQIPLEPDTGAGVLLVARVSDRDADVGEHALELATRLKDRVVARNLARYVHEVMRLVHSGFFHRQHTDVELVVGLFVHRAIRIIGQTGDTETLPDILDAVRYYLPHYRKNLWDVGEIMEALGSLGDERAVEVMLPVLSNETIRRANYTPEGDRASQTIGDTALYGLLKIYHLDPKAFGLVFSADRQFYGFLDPSRRAAGHRKFRKWYQDNASKPPAQRGAPTSAPVAPTTKPAVPKHGSRRP